jgi:hypothetical protein
VAGQELGEERRDQHLGDVLRAGDADDAGDVALEAVGGAREAVHHRLHLLGDR